MARPRKLGFEYYPHDCDMSEDLKVVRLESKHGLLGYAIYNKILERKYKDENFTLADDFMLEYFAKKWGVTTDKLKEVLDFMISECKLFENYDCDSEGITVRRDTINKVRSKDRVRKLTTEFKKQEDTTNKFSEKLSTSFPRVFHELSTTKESKAKQSKVNKIHTDSDESESSVLKRDFDFNILEDDDFTKFALGKLRNPPKDNAMEDEKKMYDKIVASLLEQVFLTWNDLAEKYNVSAVKTLTEKRRKGILARFREKEFDIIKIYELIKTSNFLRGLIPGKTWTVTFDWVFTSTHNYIKILEGVYNRDTIAKLNGNQSTATDERGRIESASKQYEKILKTVVTSPDGE